MTEGKLAAALKEAAPIALASWEELAAAEVMPGIKSTLVRIKTGTATIKGIATNNSGRFVIFTIGTGTTVAFKHNASTEAQSLHLAGGAEFAANENDVIAFVWIGWWRECFRSANT